MPPKRPISKPTAKSATRVGSSRPQPRTRAADPASPVLDPPLNAAVSDVPAFSTDEPEQPEQVEEAPAPPVSAEVHHPNDAASSPKHPDPPITDDPLPPQPAPADAPIAHQPPKERAADRRAARERGRMMGRPRATAASVPGADTLEADERRARFALDSAAERDLFAIHEDAYRFLVRFTPLGALKQEARAREVAEQLEQQHWSLIVTAAADDRERVVAIDDHRRVRLAREADARAQRLAAAKELQRLWRQTRSDFIIQHNVWLAEYADRQAREKERRFAVREEALRRLQRDDIEREYNDRERRRAERERLRDRREWEREQRCIAREERERERERRVTERNEFEARDRAVREAYLSKIRRGDEGDVASQV